MGYSLSWLAIKGKTPAQILDQLRFTKTGRTEPFPESALTAAELPSGYCLLVSNRSDEVAPDSSLAQLTMGAEAVTCFVEEHVMVSSATGWKDGEKIWSVLHDSQKEPHHLQTDGQLPASFHAIRERLETEQKQADESDRGVDFIFDIPVSLAFSKTGYRYDKRNDDLHFEVLSAPPEEKISAPLKGFFRRFIGAASCVTLVISYFGAPTLSRAASTNIWYPSALTNYSLPSWNPTNAIPLTPDKAVITAINDANQKQAGSWHATHISLQRYTPSNAWFYTVTLEGPSTMTVRVLLNGHVWKPGLGTR
jgi:hypothetical protein